MEAQFHPKHQAMLDEFARGMAEHRAAQILLPEQPEHVSPYLRSELRSYDQYVAALEARMFTNAEPSNASL